MRYFALHTIRGKPLQNVIARPEGPWQSLAFWPEKVIVAFEIASLRSQ